MSKKLNLFRLIMSLALAATLLLGMTLPALASSPPIITDPSVLAGAGTDKDHQFNAGITKILEMPKGTTLPSGGLTFTFTVTKEESNKIKPGDSGWTTAAAAMPTIDPITITITSSDVNTNNISNNDTIIVKKESHSTGTSMFPRTGWPATGTYVYRVKEVPGSSNPLVNSTANYIEKTWYSTAEYLLNVYVKADATGAFYVYMVGALKEICESDENPSQDANVKVDPRPGTENGDSNANAKFSKVIFRNQYMKFMGEDPNTDNPQDYNKYGLQIKKKVEGVVGDTTKYFAFSMMAFNPEGTTFNPLLPTFYRAYIMDANGRVTDTTNNIPSGTVTGTDGRGNTYIEIDLLSTVNFSLKDGQWLNIIDMPVGSSYKVSETGNADYAPKIDIKLNGTIIDLGTVSKSFGENISTDTSEDPVQKRYIADGINDVLVTNTHKETAMTGVAMDDLPYIALLALIVGAGVTFMVIKYRKAARQNAG